MFYRIQNTTKYIFIILFVITASSIYTPLNYAESSEYVKVSEENSGYKYEYKISDISSTYAIGNALFVDFKYYNPNPNIAVDDLSFKITYGEGLRYKKVVPIFMDFQTEKGLMMRLEDPKITEHIICHTSPSGNETSANVYGTFLFEVIDSKDCYINVEIIIGNDTIHQEPYVFSVDDSISGGAYELFNKDYICEFEYQISPWHDASKSLMEGNKLVKEASFVPQYRVTIKQDGSESAEINDFSGLLSEPYYVDDNYVLYKIGELNLSTLTYPCTIVMDEIKTFFPDQKGSSDFFDGINGGYRIPAIYNSVRNSISKTGSIVSETTEQSSQDNGSEKLEMPKNDESQFKSKTLWIVSVVLLSAAGISVKMGLLAIAKSVINDYNILRTKKDTDSKKITPIGYWKLRKSTLFFCENEVESILIKKDTVNFATERTIELELEPYFSKPEYPVVFVRYPLRAMQYKTDVNIKYYYYNKLVSSDFFADETSFVNVKRIEKKM